MLVAPSPATAQGIRAQVRGKVKDADGNPLKDVTIEFHYKGEKQGRVARFKVKTGKNGGYVRIGLVGGPYTVTYFKEGYKTYEFDTYFGGGLSELPDCILAKIPESVRKLVAPGASAKDLEEARKKAAEMERLRDVLEKTAVAVEAKDWATAEGLLQEVLKAAPNQPLVWANLGVVAKEKGDLPAAEKAYRKVIELDPNDGESYAVLALLIDRQDRGGEAYDLLMEAEPRFENDRAFQATLGPIAMNTQHMAEAEAAFKKVAELDPTNGDVHFHLASLALNQNHTAEAIAHLEQCIALCKPDSENANLAKQLLAALKK